LTGTLEATRASGLRRHGVRIMRDADLLVELRTSQGHRKEHRNYALAARPIFVDSK